MPNPKRVSLRLIARQAIDGWAVDVVKDSITVQRGVPVRDPLSPDQRSTCRWYLEQYVKSLPFSADRAREAELLLEIYPEELLRQLSLREVLAPDFDDAPSTLDSVLLSIEICQSREEGGCAVDTIHQLFWELLEDPELWFHPRLAVIVERSVSSSSPLDLPSPTDRLDCWPQPDGTLTLNVLVVVARNLNQTPSLHDDISPCLATDALIRVQKCLADAQSPVQISLEIVRPGTFAAFVQHLEQATSLHGRQGYFHVVHFDMHGAIGPRKGKPHQYGYLAFSDPASDGTTLVPGQVVGRTLQKFEVPFAVLNACESARASLGEDANVAQQFLKHGVRSVLGMSFEIAASAATLFLEAFYRALLVRGGSFSEAAAAGRSVLRRNPMRPARYHRQQARRDSFVAVTYGPAGGWPRPLAHGTILLPGHGLDRHAFAPGHPEPPEPHAERSRLHGRDFDLLRLEKRLLQTHAVYLHGWAGVGKSAFLNHAISQWKSTRFVDAVVAIDFAHDPISAGQEVSLAVLRQLLAQVSAPKHQSRLWTMPARALQSYSHGLVGAIVTEILAGIESILVFDGLDIPLMPHPSHLAPPPPESSVAGLCQLLNSLVELGQSANPTKKPRLVLAARRGDASWLETRMGRPFRPLRYELPALDLASAVDLAHQVLQTCGEDTQQWSYADADHLVSIVQLLACNPSALLGMLPLQRALKIEWRLFYQGLHHGLFASVADLERAGLGTCRFAQEIRYASLNLRQGHFFFVCLFALYWDEAVSVATLQSIFSETANASQRQDLYSLGRSGVDYRWPSVLLSFALDRGYVHGGDDGACLHIHPLLTVVGRAYLSNFVTPVNRKILRTAFCSSLESLDSHLVQQQRGLRVGFANILLSVEFCLTDVPPKNWPLSLFAALCDPARLGALPLTTRSVPQERIFQLLKLLSAKFPEVAQKERYMTFFILVLIRIVSNPENSSQTWERASEFASIGLRLLPLLKQQNLGLNIENYRSCLLFVQLLSSFPSEDDTGRQGSWQALVPLKDELCESLGQKGSPLPDLQHLDLLSAGTDGIRSMVRGIQDAQDPNMEFSDSCNFVLALALRLIEANKEELVQTTTPRTETYQQRTAISEQRAPDVSVDIDIGQFKRMVGFDDRNLRTIPMAMTEADTHRNKVLEDSYETGDWMQSLEHHERMILEAMKGYRFEEAEQHAESMRAILTKVAAPHKLFDALDAKKKKMQAIHKRYLVWCTLNQSDTEDGVHTAEEPRPEDALGEPKSTHKSQMPHPTRQGVQDMAVAMKEFENPRKWWEWWERGSSQGSGWITQVYDNSVRYPEEARLMNEVHGACMAHDMNVALSLINELDALCSDGIFADYDLRPSPLLQVRNYFESALCQSQILHDWQAALARDDFTTARALLDNLSARVRLDGISTSPTPGNIKALYVVTDRELLLDFTLQFHAAAKAGQLSSCQKLYRGFLDLVDKGELGHIRAEEIMVIRSEALGMLMQQTGKDKKWKDGISYCDEYLTLCNGLRQCDLQARDSCIQVKARCEWGLAQEDLLAAETSLDFDRCLELVDVMERLYETQKTTPGRVRSEFVFLGPKHVAFLKGSYRDRCLCCARWSHQRVPGDCPFPDGRGPNHNRSIFLVPFGCSHHCKGGYCWWI